MSDHGAGLTNILGEVLWHTATKDDSIALVSHYHAYEVLRHAGCLLPARANAPIRFLEVAAYAHTTGYLLAQRHGWNATLSDISVETLALGAKYASESGLDPERVRRVAVDFHDLPFPDGAFDVVLICSALHHTLRWQTVLGELLRVTAPGGLLILLNEPCQRQFCFYSFPTNRPDAFRPVEAELDRLGILSTVAEPFVGSRPETLFGMVENQKMPLPEILQLLRSRGTVESLTIKTHASMSHWDHELLAARAVPEQLPNLSATIEAGLRRRLDEARGKLTGADLALGIRIPEPAEVATMALNVARSIQALPLPSASAQRKESRDRLQDLGAATLSTLRWLALRVYRMPLVGAFASSVLKVAARWGYLVPAMDALVANLLLRLWAGPAVAARDFEIAVANIFGGAFAAVVRKSPGEAAAERPDELRYAGASRKGVFIGYPPVLNRLLESTHDLVPDIQTAAPGEIARHFPEGEWKIGGNGTIRELILLETTADIRLRPASAPGRYVVLLRMHGAPLDGPLRVQLLAGDTEIAGFDLYQADSFLLRGELPAGHGTPALKLAVRRLDREPLKVGPPVSVLAARVVCVANDLSACRSIAK